MIDVNNKELDSLTESCKLFIASRRNMLRVSTVKTISSVVAMSSAKY